MVAPQGLASPSIRQSIVMFSTLEATGRCTKSGRQGQSFWPLANAADMDFAIAFNSTADKIWIFYMVDGVMNQIHQSGEASWEAAIALPSANSTDVGSEESHEVLSAKGKLGIGLGVGLGTPICIAAIAIFIYLRRRRSRPSVETLSTAPSQTQSKHASSHAPGHSSGGWIEGGYWANGQWVPVQNESSPNQQYINGSLGPQPVHEMPPEERAHEVAGDGQTHEMPGFDLSRK
jgi:hypothetical protein